MVQCITCILKIGFCMDVYRKKNRHAGKTCCAKVVFCFWKCGLLPSGNLMLFKSKHLKTYLYCKPGVLYVLKGSQKLLNGIRILQGLHSLRGQRLWLMTFQDAKEPKASASEAAYTNKPWAPGQQFGVCRKWYLLLLSPVMGQSCHKPPLRKKGRTKLHKSSGNGPKDKGCG